VIFFISIVQLILLLGHFFLYETWAFSSTGIPIPQPLWLKLTVAILSISFVASSVLAFRYMNRLLRAFYTASAIWLGLFSFLFLGAVFSWLIFAITGLAHINSNFHRIVEWLFVAALIAASYALLNASWTRITRITIRLANLPANWRGRSAALISDLHLGHVRNSGFLRRMVAKIAREKPHAVFIAGDLYDGTAIDARRAAEPLRQLSAPHGVYFVAGNHEQFRDDTEYLNAVAATGVRVLRNEKLDVDGLQIIGVPYRHATSNGHFASVLREIRVDPTRASILLTHAPDHPEVAEAAGVSLQLSGHTHLGQFIPWSWLARRIYRQFVYGLNRLGNLQVFTSSGAGTWGPPFRLGSISEIVFLHFE